MIKIGPNQLKKIIETAERGYKSLVVSEVMKMEGQVLNDDDSLHVLIPGCEVRILAVDLAEEESPAVTDDP